MSEYRLAEKPTLDALTALGYRLLSPEAAMTMRQEENRVILKPVLAEALQALNGISAADAEAIYGELSTLSDNEEWQRKLRGAYSRRLTGEARDRPITLIDFKHPDRNRYHVVRQFRVAAQRARIADIVVFVNGIPLVVIEAKSPLKAAARAEEAFEQIKQYERDIPRLFHSNAFNLVTDGMTTLYGATGSPSQFYAPWPDAWPRSRDEFADDLSKDLWCLMEPSRLLDMLAHFIVFETDPESGRKIKKICRYQQFRAVNKAVARVAEGKLKKGLIWHTQGSGKSLTMVFLALKLKTHLTLDAPTLQNPNILVLTDRIDLDDQISKTFVACGLPNPKQAASVGELREAVARGGNGQILLSTIFKFAGSKDPIPTSENWIVLVDECHRTQEKDLGAFLSATLPDARFFGLTGTPIKSTDKDTYARFSEPGVGYLDKYGIDDAVRDGATVPILYEGRKTDWSINEAELDILFDRWFVDLPDEKREKLKAKGLTLATIAKHPERVRLVALDIWEHFKQVCQPDGFKAQIVVVDREAVVLYAVGKLAAEGREDDWFELQRLTRNFVRVYGDLSPDPAILEFTAEVKWAAAFLRLATQVISKDESLDHKSYTGKIRDMLEEHVHATGLSTTIRLRSITDPNFADDFEVEEKTEEELQDAFVRKSAELRRVTRELVDKNPAQYGRFSERVLEIIRRFEEGQIAAAEGLKDFEDLTGGINAEQGAHADLGMDERAFSILRIMEEMSPDTDHASLQAAAVGVGQVYASAQGDQPSWFFMDGYKKDLRKQVRPILRTHGVTEASAVSERVEEFAVHAYAGPH